MTVPFCSARRKHPLVRARPRPPRLPTLSFPRQCSASLLRHLSCLLWIGLSPRRPTLCEIRRIPTRPPTRPHAPVQAPLPPPPVVIAGQYVLFGAIWDAFSVRHHPPPTSTLIHSSTNTPSCSPTPHPPLIPCAISHVSIAMWTCERGRLHGV